MNLINIILISFILQFVSQTPVLRTYSIVMNLIWSSRREIYLKSTHSGNKGFGGNGWSLSSNKSASGSWFVCLEGERELPVVLLRRILNSAALFTACCLCCVKKVSWEPPVNDKGNKKSSLRRILTSTALFTTFCFFPVLFWLLPSFPFSLS